MTVEVDETGNAARVRRTATRLPPDITSAGAARDFVCSALRSWAVPEQLVFDVVLAASELVTNAVEHGSGDVEVDLSVARGLVLLRVHDDTADEPVRGQPTPMSTNSRGLGIVDTLSSAWGHQPTADGKWVWAEFPLSALDRPLGTADSTPLGWGLP
ncbi:ATP-binding protein [Actinokineospora sp.]|uniref:ATP-binding protein n=1 Tax=Actinokineospora sp. TaxID=1872133 RepID=UPI004037E0F2